MMARLKQTTTVMLTLVLMAFLCGSALAVNPDEILDDPALEQRAREISAGLRCLVCQNQSIDDSDAPLARDLRILVRERLVEGDSDAQVRRFLVDRYGEFVLLKPSFSLKNLVLWGFGPLVLLLGLLVVHRLHRKNRQLAQSANGGLSKPLSEEEQEQLKKILSTDRDT